LPLPAYDLLPELKTHYYPVFNNVDNFPAFSIMNSRGCFGKCTFCDRGTFGNKITRHGSKYVVDLIQILKNEYKIKYLVFDDDNFVVNKKYLFEILDLMIERKIKMPFTCESRVDTIDEEKIIKLKKAGCTRIMYGVESGSQKMLDLMNKHITLNKIKETIKLTQKHKIKTLGYMMIGFPGETKGSLEETVKFIQELNMFDIAVSVFTPLPGAEIYKSVNQLENFEEKWDRPDSLKDPNYIPKGLTKENIQYYVEAYYNACYNKWWQYLKLPMRMKTIKHAKLVIKGMLKIKK